MRIQLLKIMVELVDNYLFSCLCYFLYTKVHICLHGTEYANFRFDYQSRQWGHFPCGLRRNINGLLLLYVNQTDLLICKCGSPFTTTETYPNDIIIKIKVFRMFRANLQFKASACYIQQLSKSMGLSCIYISIVIYYFNEHYACGLSSAYGLRLCQ